MNIPRNANFNIAALLRSFLQSLYVGKITHAYKFNVKLYTKRGKLYARTLYKQFI